MVYSKKNEIDLISSKLSKYKLIKETIKKIIEYSFFFYFYKQSSI